MASLTRYISLSRSLAVSTNFGVNCASAAMKETRAGMVNSGAASSTIRASSPRPMRPTSRVGRKIVMKTSERSSKVTIRPPEPSTAPGCESLYSTRPATGAAISVSLSCASICATCAFATASAARASPTAARAPCTAAFATSRCARRWSTVELGATARWSNSSARFISISARVRLASWLATSASARKMPCSARRTAAFAAACWALSSVASSRTTRLPAGTKSPSRTRISAMRPGILVETSTRSTSMRPLARARPSGTRALASAAHCR